MLVSRNSKNHSRSRAISIFDDTIQSRIASTTPEADKSAVSYQ